MDKNTRVKAPADAEYIKKVAAYLDEKMIEVQSGFSTTQSSWSFASFGK